MTFRGRAKQITVRAIVGRMSDHFIKLGKEFNRVARHLNVNRGRELYPHSPHALPGRAPALMRFAFYAQTISTAGLVQMISDARSDDAAADDDHVRGFNHGFWLNRLSCCCGLG